MSKRKRERYRWITIVEMSSQGMTPEWWLRCNNPLHGHYLPIYFAEIPAPMSITVIMDEIGKHERRYGEAE